MLDFYLICDTEAKPEFPGNDNLVFGGSLSIKTFNNLQSFGTIENDYFYLDFRWNSIIVKQMFEHNYKNGNTDIIELVKILRKAKERKLGLVAYSD